MKVKKSITKYVITLYEEVEMDVSKVSMRSISGFWEYLVVFSPQVFMLVVVFINVLGYSVIEFFAFLVGFVLTYLGMSLKKAIGPVVVVVLMAVMLFVGVPLVYAVFNGFVLAFVADVFTKFQKPFITENGEIITFRGLEEKLVKTMDANT